MVLVTRALSIPLIYGKATDVSMMANTISWQQNFFLTGEGYINPGLNNTVHFKMPSWFTWFVFFGSLVIISGKFTYISLSEHC